MTEMNISLNPEQAKIIESKIASGSFRDANAVICAALSSLDELQRIKFEKLKTEIENGLAEIEKGDFAEYSLGYFVNKNNGLNES
jgi:putative addiction module CopG family antidote